MVQTFTKLRNYAMLGIVLSVAIVAVGINSKTGLGGHQYNSSLPSYVAIAAIFASAGLVAYG